MHGEGNEIYGYKEKLKLRLKGSVNGYVYILHYLNYSLVKKKLFSLTWDQNGWWADIPIIYC